jgi:hypothetical protein
MPEPKPRVNYGPNFVSLRDRECTDPVKLFRKYHIDGDDKRELPVSAT